jgi:hypothetical protein
MATVSERAYKLTRELIEAEFNANTTRGSQ